LVPGRRNGRSFALHNGNRDKLGEKIAVRRFARFKAGGNSWSAAAADREGPEGGDEAGIAVKKPKRPNLNSGFAATKLDEESD